MSEEFSLSNSAPCLQNFYPNFQRRRRGSFGLLSPSLARAKFVTSLEYLNTLGDILINKIQICVEYLFHIAWHKDYHDLIINNFSIINKNQLKICVRTLKPTQGVHLYIYILSCGYYRHLKNSTLFFISIMEWK